MTPTMEFPKLLDLALAEVQQTTRQLMAAHGLDRFPAWEFDAAHGALIFRRPGVDQFAVAAQIIGYHHPAASLWQWAWDDPAVPENFRRSAVTARNWGATQGIDLLTAATTFAEEPLAWRLTAFAARLTGCPGIYRGESGARFTYFAFAVLNA